LAGPAAVTVAFAKPAPREFVTVPVMLGAGLVCAKIAGAAALTGPASDPVATKQASAALMKKRKRDVLSEKI
jgi:hypothetical protein